MDVQTDPAGCKREDNVLLTLFVCNVHACNNRKRAENYRATQILDPSLMSFGFLFFFLPFSLKGPNSRVAQIPHCTGGKEEKQKESQRKE